MSVPQGYKSSTSYEDYDTIHGSRKEWRIPDLLKQIDDINDEIKRLSNKLKLDKDILANRLEEVNINEYLKAIEETTKGKRDINKKKVKFLRECGFTQEAAAKKIGITEKQVYRIERSIRNAK